jgi:hypothetical protein
MFKVNMSNFFYDIAYICVIFDIADVIFHVACDRNMKHYATWGKIYQNIVNIIGNIRRSAYFLP